jgi:D-aspartate ligase
MPTASRTPAAIVIGLDSITGLQSARILAARGIPVIGIAADRRHPSCRTRFADVIHAPTSGDALIDELLCVSHKLADRPVLVPCTDLSVLTISRRRNVLDGFCRMVLPDEAMLERLVDKAAFHEYALSRDLPVANGVVLRHLADLNGACATLRFPCVMKPAIKATSWIAQAPAKVIRCETPVALRRAYLAHASLAEAFIVQEWIEGPPTAHFTCNAYFDRDSIPVATFVSQKLRQWPLEGGVGCFSRECRNDDVLEETVRLFQGANHRGLAYLEMKFDARTGRHVIIEPNVGRPTGRSAAADTVGVDLLYTLYCDALGQPLPAIRPHSYGCRKWIYLRQDCQAAFQLWRRGQMTPWEWIDSLRGCHRDAVFSWTDPMPFIADVAKAVSKARARARRTPGKRIEVRSAGKSVDYDVHGIVGVRIRDASPSDLAAVARQLGPIRDASLDRQADVTVRFVDEVSTANARYVEYGRTAFTDDAFILLRDGRQAIKAEIAFDKSGHVEIVCQRGIKSVPLLLPLLSRAVRARGSVALHASAAAFDGTGLLMPAWAHGGKTTGLLATLTQGAGYVGDEWIVLRGDGSRIFGLLRPLELHGWQHDQIPAARPHIPSAVRLTSATVRGLSRVGVPSRIVRGLDRRLDRSIDPTELFEAAGTPLSAWFRAVVWMVRHDARRVRIERADLATTVRRIAASVASEEATLLDIEHAYSFAFPERNFPRSPRPSDVLERTLRRALAGKDLFVVYHPAPCNLHELGAAVASVCGASVAAVGTERAATGHTPVPATSASA